MRCLIPLALLMASGCYRLGPADYNAAIDRDGDGVVGLAFGGHDCDDADPEVSPGADEVCDGIDNDCDGQTDEGDALDASAWYDDGDGDGYGLDSSLTYACGAPNGYVADNTDCDDDDETLNPETPWYADTDGDNHGDPDTSVQQCLRPEGYVRDDTDCDDARSDVNPAEVELCDETDHDCDGHDGLVDDDGDGWAACEGDCDEGDASVHPGADEYCDGIDNDCDLGIDEDDALDALAWYPDVDGDGYGDADAKPTIACVGPEEQITDNRDCDDTDAEISPDATEICDGYDNDCDGHDDFDINVPTDVAGIQDAVDAATAGQHICVLDGSHEETVFIDKDIILEGQSRDGTVIDADGAGAVMTLDGLSTAAEIRGFTLTGGTSTSGAAITITSSEALLEDLLIKGHVQNHIDSPCLGALVSVVGGTPIIDGLELRDNELTCDGLYGLIHASDRATLSIDHLDIRSNSVSAASDLYAGLVADNATAYLANVIIAGNIGECWDGECDARGMAFAGIEGSTIEVTNATIYANEIAAGAGVAFGAVLDSADGGTVLYNVTVSGNTATGAEVRGSVASVSNAWDYSNFYDQAEPLFGDGYEPVGLFANIGEDPAFSDVSSTDPEDWDLTLSTGSLLIDAGDSTLSDADGSRSDIGAYGGPGGDGW
jgi:hypothetical protein